MNDKEFAKLKIVLAVSYQLTFQIQSSKAFTHYTAWITLFQHAQYSFYQK